ncbi:MAG: hypothetical protein COW13_05515, partial [Candidatus Omnitrophica bacterium CG12_big_fil_rev_8_21_14_0_65_50_5]
GKKKGRVQPEPASSLPAGRQAADGLAMDDAQVEQVYQEAVASYDKGDYLAAQGKFQAIEDVRKNYKDSNDYLKRDHKVQEIYKEARVLFDRGELKKAREEFELVDRALPGYKQTVNFLKEIDRRTQEAAAKTEAVRIKKEKSVRKKAAQEVKPAAGEPLAAEVYQIQTQSDDKRRKDEELKVLDDQAKQFAQELRKDRLTEKRSREDEERAARDMARARREELDELYARAKADYDHRDYISAQEKFEDVLKRELGYKSTRRYLQKIKEALEREGQQKRTLAMQTPVMKESAPVELERLDVPLPKEKAVKEPGPDIQETVKRRQEQIARIVEEKYTQALAFYKDKNYPEAKYKFVEAEAMSPNYKKTRSYLEKLDDQIAKARLPPVPLAGDEQAPVKPVKEKPIHVVPVTQAKVEPPPASPAGRPAPMMEKPAE